MQDLILAGANIADAVAFWIRAQVFFQFAGGVGITALMVFLCWGAYRLAVFAGKDHG